MTESVPGTPGYLFVIASFDDADTAPRVLANILAARREKRVATPAVASIRRGPDGTVEIDEPGDVGAAEGAVAGGLLGGLLGGIFGRHALRGAALGAALGALGASRHDAGIPNPRLAEIGAGLGAGTSAVAAIVAGADLAPLQGLLEGAGGHVVIESMEVDYDVASQLKAGRYGEATASLGTHAEGLIGEAKARLADLGGPTTLEEPGAPTLPATGSHATPGSGETDG